MARCHEFLGLVSSTRAPRIRPRIPELPIIAKNGVITIVTRKYGRKYGWRQRAPGREFRGAWSRNSGDQNLILWRNHEIRWFDDHTTEAPHSAVDTAAPDDGPNFAAVPRNFPVVVAENFGRPDPAPKFPSVPHSVFTAVFRGRFWLFARARRKRMTPAGAP